MQKIINFDDVTKENIKQHNPNWPQIGHNWIDHTYRLLIIRGSGSIKIISLFNLIIQQPDVDKIIYTIKIHMKQNNLKALNFTST